MELTKKTIDNVEFTFVNESKGNRTGFYHESVLLMNGYQIAKHRSQYYNRTWEQYRFQTSMKCAVSDAVKQELLEDYEHYKRHNNVSRLSSKVKEEIAAKNKTVQLLQKLYETLDY